MKTKIIIPEYGAWLFTCAMHPKQFCNVNVRDPLKWFGDEQYKDVFLKMSEVEQFNFINDDFDTIDGSGHSFANCSCKLISKQYALWFLSNNISSIYDELKKTEDDVNIWQKYEDAIKVKCFEDGIEYEGY